MIDDTDRSFALPRIDMMARRQLRPGRLCGLRPEPAWLGDHGLAWAGAVLTGTGPLIRFCEGRSCFGTKGLKGIADSSKIMEMYRTAGHGWVEQDEVACWAAFIGHCLERARFASARAAVLAFRADKGLGLGPDVDPVVAEALQKARSRAVSRERADGKPVGSRIVKTADAQIATGIVGIAGGCGLGGGTRPLRPPIAGDELTDSPYLC